MKDDLNIPLAFLMSASDTSLENFELKRLEYAANLEKEIKLMQAEAQRYRTAAEAAGWIRANRTELLRASGSNLETVGRREDAA